jgi:hypothetical protein
VVFPHLAGASQADDTAIRITGHTAGATPFISKLSIEASNTTVLKSIQFTVTPKPGSVTRPLSGTYANYYLVDRGFENSQTGEIILPVYGLCDGYTNLLPPGTYTAVVRGANAGTGVGLAEVYTLH